MSVIDVLHVVMISLGELRMDVNSSARKIVVVFPDTFLIFCRFYQFPMFFCQQIRHI